MRLTVTESTGQVLFEDLCRRKKFFSTKLASAARGALALAMFSALLLIGYQSAHAQTETVLYSFGSQAGDGSQPYTALLMDKNGNLYGTTVNGGAQGNGTVFKLTSAGVESVLYAFCSQSGCTDGAHPSGGLIRDKKGNLYGTTTVGGNTSCNFGSGCGTVFKLTAAGVETVLYNFCSQSNCADGQYPRGSLVMDKVGNLYGTTYQGGNNSNGGTVFKLTPSGTFTQLYTFLSQPGDGCGPQAAMIIDKLGNLYGTASYCNVAGTVFKVTPEGKETTLYAFCSQNCLDGEYPFAGVVMDKKGNLYGTTTQGGTNLQGVVFELTPTGKETVLYTFCSQPNCTDGEGPYGGLVIGKKGNLYGTTNAGGANNGGTVYEVTPKGVETVVYNFGSQSGDGGNPNAALIMDKTGNFYGTTVNGGLHGHGTVFKLTP